MVPHLSTALNGPINELEQRIIDSMPATERWFRLEWMEHMPAFYCAADIRNAGFKLAAVETNLYPGGWNYLSEATLPLAVQAAQAAIEKICPEARNLLLVPENHASHDAYWGNIAQLVRIFRMAGLNVRVGSISNEIKEPTRIEWPGAAASAAVREEILLEPVIRTERRLGLKNFDPCTVLINNDLSEGTPGILEELYEQYVLPPVHAGWHVRRRSRHLACHEEVSKRFCKMLGIDPWLITPLFSACGAVDLRAEQGMETLRSQVDALLTRIRRKYKEYGIQERPFVAIKADKSPCSASVLTVHSVDELQDCADKLRGKACAKTDKEQGTHDLVLQEGVLSHEYIDDTRADPVVYMMDRYVVGGFYWLHGNKLDGCCTAKADQAQCVPLTFDKSSQLPEPGVKPGASVPNRFYMYGVVARLAMLAASYELEATDPEAILQA